jgi:hypothetical protein
MPILFLVHLSPIQRRFVRGVLKVVLLLIFAAGLIYTFVVFRAIDQRLDHPKKHTSLNAQLHPPKDRL